jgi:hypothetical protein
MASKRSLPMKGDDPVSPYVIGTMFAINHSILSSLITLLHLARISVMDTESAPDTSHHASQEFTRKAIELRILVEELANSAPDAAKELLLGLKKGIALLCDQGKECTISSVANRVVATVRAHPVQVAAATVGAGLITWSLLSRRG